MNENSNLPSVQGNHNGLDLLNAENLANMQRLCRMFASSDLVPDIYKTGPDNPEPKAIGNCMIAIDIAHRIGASPLMIMQNMVPIYGKPSWSSKFLIATVNTCGRFNPLQYRFRSLGMLGKVQYIDYVWNPQTRKKEAVQKTFPGENVENLECVAFTTAKGTTDILEGVAVTIELAVQEGWYTKNGSKWVTMTRQMLVYRAASFWVNAYAPELSMGMKTVEERMDIQDIEYEDVTEKSKKTRDEILTTQANSKELVVDEVPEEQAPEPKKPELSMNGNGHSPQGPQF